MKLVSVIVPVYNVEVYLADTIRSVLAQTYPHFELILVDDESPDQSVAIAECFTDPRLKIVRQKNRGLAGARNTGIRHAQGDYLAFLDADDLWLPEKLAKHVQHLDANPQVGISFSRSAFIDQAGQSLGLYQMPQLTDITAEHLLCRNPIGNGSAPVIRRQVFEAIRFQQNRTGIVEDFYFDEDFRRSEDIECWLRIKLLTDWQLEGIPEALTLYRVNEAGLSADVERQFESWQQIITKTRTYAPELIAQWGDVAKAYQLRYLARRAVRFKAPQAAVPLIHQALAAHWQIVLAEPRRTLLTLGAAYLLQQLPLPLYSALESGAVTITGALQRSKIQRQSLAKA
ncbi:glycosyltransferase family 2 protein [Synechocystis sp. LKSZ1]|uniref:glycosyltransferase family 2 protein n=1 Tax=Synechocystis sp. LKSZ1 TaxID=3144951 RepID=UPI00336BE60B